MTAYYNEISDYASQWLRNLIAAGHLPAGDVDTRSIAEVQPDDLRGYSEAHFFAGLGGWPLALSMAGWGSRPVWTGSVPCQSFSVAGKGRGVDDERHLWPEFYRLIAECRPATVFGEQVRNAISHGWLDLVFDDLEAAGYSCGAAVIPACSVGAPHIRQRLWWVADAEWDFQSWEESFWRGDFRVGRVQQPLSWDECWECALTKFRALDDGIPRSVGATDAARNAIVPPLAAEFVSAFMECRP